MPKSKGGGTAGGLPCRAGRAWLRAELIAGTKIMQRRLLLSAFAATFAGPALAQGFSEAQRAEILSILRDALRRDPSLLRDGLGALQAAEDQERFSAQSDAIRAHEAACSATPPTRCAAIRAAMSRLSSFSTRAARFAKGWRGR